MNINSPSMAKFSSGEKKVFQSMLELYDAKEYPKALAKADQLEETYPTHAEIQSFKALILNNMKRQAEAFKII